MEAFRQFLLQAAEQRATHIHLEASRVRFRIDGILRTVEGPAADLLAKAEAQPRRQTSELAGANYLVICSLAQLVEGRKAVVRLLKQPPQPHQAEDLETRQPLARVLPKIEKALTHRQGLIVITGPARSGLSTTLAAWGALLTEHQPNLVHWSDDGSALAGATQVTREVSASDLLDYDPDVVLVDRARNLGPEHLRELAWLAARYTVVVLWPGWSDACELLLSLKELGVVPSLIRTVVNQRLVRRLCPKCKLATVADHPLLPEGASIFRSQGCSECHGTGYNGQLALFEVVEVEAELKELLRRPTPLARLRQTTFSEALFRDGLDQLQAGHTSLEEAERVLGPAPLDLAIS